MRPDQSNASQSIRSSHPGSRHPALHRLSAPAIKKIRETNSDFVENKQPAPKKNPPIDHQIA
jgi:hypothetical protein